MQCPRCQHDNLPAAKFCQECATPLARPCTNCGSQLPPSAEFRPECAHPAGAVATPQSRYTAPESYTPKHLAEKILTSKAALEGERKLVTVLFADLKGSMELLADRDPEEARKLLDPVLERMIEAVQHYEGTVNQVMGDGIMALFGAPLAHEDHAVRACYAALRMQESVKKYAEEARRSHAAVVKIRVGLNSGEVVVRSIGSDLHMDYTAVGQTTHVAARLEQMTLPGAVLISPETLALAEGYVLVKPLGPRPIRGLERPLEVYGLVGAATVRSRFQAAAARGLTHFVGRESELDQLCQALERARAGHGQLVTVVGEPGVGKSRLYWEFTHSHRAQGWLVLESGSVSYGKATNYLPILELLRTYFSIEHADDPRKIREKVTGKLLSLDRQLEPCISPILWLLDVPIEDEQWERLDPPQRRQRILDGVKRLLLRESRVRPLMVLFEDLHWIDAETQALLDSLVESLPTARMLLLVNYRPEYSHGWGSKTYYRQVQIDPLPTESAEALLDALLGSDATLAPLFKRLVIERTEGNPFFIEESVRSLVETGVLAGERGAYRLTRLVQSLQVPATAQAMLAARIDRLDPEDKRLLQAAAVIGTHVPWGLLKAVADEPEDRLRRGLAQLQATEFLYETQLFPDLEYAFRHALTHEVAYGSLLAERRRALHARIVSAIEALYGDRLDEQVERLAHHALRGELREKAVHYLRQAGNKAAARSALHDARVWFEQALGALATLPESRSTLEQAFEVRLELRQVLAQAGDLPTTLEHLREAEALAERLNDDRRRGRVWAFMTNVHSLLEELDEALVTGTRAEVIVGQLGDLRLRILTTTYLEHMYFLRGEYERVVELATDNVAALPSEWVYEYFGIGAPPSVFDRCWLVMSLAQLGRFAEATKHEADATRLAQSTHHMHTLGQAYRAGATLRLLEGDWAKARSTVERGLATTRTGSILLRSTALALSAWVLAQVGQASEALERLQEGEQLLRHRLAQGVVSYRSWDYHALARAGLLLGRLDEAEGLGDRAAEFSSGQPGYAAYAFHLLGDIATHPDRFDAERGEAHYRQALALAEPRGMRPLAAHCHLGLGKLYRRTGKLDDAHEHLTTATTMYREIDMRFYLEQAEAAMREVM
jgi:class 3 adenylate cyclase/tetratricopeptide (TPR) repeat protein